MSDHRPSHKGRTTPMYPFGEGAPKRTCFWCGEPLTGHAQCWCDKECGKIGGYWGWFMNRGAGHGTRWIRTRQRVIWRDNITCQECGICPDRPARVYREGTGYRANGGISLEVHHIKPRSKGGTDDDDNLVTLCQTCHDKPAAHPELHYRAVKREEGDGW